MRRGPGQARGCSQSRSSSRRGVRGVRVRGEVVDQRLHGIRMRVPAKLGVETTATMTSPPVGLRPREGHRTHHIGWLRAAVLGANDGLISTSSLVVGVAAAEPPPAGLMVAALAGLVAGSLSMAAGEYVSVSSQADTERADLERERNELAAAPETEHAELTAVYVSRGLTPELAAQVAAQLASRDALEAHARDELGISDTSRARPLQAAFASAAAFALGALPPVVLAALWPMSTLTVAVMASSLLLLGALGAAAARLGGAPVAIGSARVAFWGAVAMGVTAMVGRLFGGTV